LWHSAGSAIAQVQHQNQGDRMRRLIQILCVAIGVAAASAAAAQSSRGGKQSHDGTRGALEADRQSYREGNEHAGRGNGHATHGNGAGNGHERGRRDAPEPLATLGLAAGGAIVAVAAWRRTRRLPTR
jgi:hypothetical protein